MALQYNITKDKINNRLKTNLSNVYSRVAEVRFLIDSEMVILFFEVYINKASRLDNGTPLFVDKITLSLTDFNKIKYDSKISNSDALTKILYLHLKTLDEFEFAVDELE